MEYRNVIRRLVVLVIMITIYLRAGNFLIVDKAPKKSGVLVVLAGDYEILIQPYPEGRHSF